MSHEDGHGPREHPGVPQPVVSPLPPRLCGQPSTQPAPAGGSNGAQQPGRGTYPASYASFSPGVSPPEIHPRMGTVNAPPVAAPVGFTAIGPVGKGPVTFQAPAAKQPVTAPHPTGSPVPTARREAEVRHGSTTA